MIWATLKQDFETHKSSGEFHGVVYRSLVGIFRIDAPAKERLAPPPSRFKRNNSPAEYRLARAMAAAGLPILACCTLKSTPT
ncbi:hypothetical protein CN138_32665 [Sinorhizobium meliloti]|nr:hypothetical protein CDO27_32895 [Sinorhizobium meliloti]MQW17476.1 hypothetical protein [Sinorhizobium meliloti]RMI18049.1 hypothetical protein DA102_020765 [Sinorhizobium meliloti]RVG54943.1 hypothetical protein CN222_35590 [Sinorhizobium meliloti]RVG56452.1 hypothetical protein CN226_03715 [Sinorhizobium meliloti]